LVLLPVIDLNLESVERLAILFYLTSEIKADAETLELGLSLREGCLMKCYAVLDKLLSALVLAGQHKINDFLPFVHHSASTAVKCECKSLNKLCVAKIEWLTGVMLHGTSIDLALQDSDIWKTWHEGRVPQSAAAWFGSWGLNRYILLIKQK